MLLHNTTRLYNLQKRVMRIITCSLYIAHTSPLFIELGLLNINDIYKVQQLKFYYKLQNSQLLFYFNNMKYPTNYQQHGVNTRGGNKLYMPRVNNEFARKCIRFRVVQTVNSMPSSITNRIQTHSLNGFTIYAKTYFIGNYEPMCNIPNCYVCTNFM